MRAELTLAAITRKSNGYALCRLAAKATRKLHRPNTRVQDTMNDALYRLSKECQQSVIQIAEPSLLEELRAA